MAKISVKAGTTSLTVNLFIMDSSSTTGAGKTGLAYNTASLTAYYCLAGAAAAAITLATQTVTGAYSSGGFVEIDATNMPGWYRFDVPNAAIASGRFSSIHFKGAANMAPLPLEIELTATDNSDSVRGGMTALPNAAAAAAGGLIILGSNNTAAITIGALTVGAIAGTTLTLSGAVAFQSTFAITGATTFTGAISGTNASNDLRINGAVPGAAGGIVIAGSNAATTFATLTSTGAFTINGVSNVSQTGDNYARLGAPAGASIAADLATIAGYIDTEVGAIYSRIGAPAGASIAADIAQVYGKVDTEVASIISTLGTPAGASLAADLATIAGYIDTEVAAIKAKTDSLTFTVANKVDANVLAIDGQTDAADRHQRAAQTMGYGTCVTAGSSTTLVATSAISPAATVADQFKDRAIAFDYNTTTANLRGVVKLITASNTSGVLTVNTLPATPATGDTFTIL